MSEVVRKHSPSNYALERMSAEGPTCWFQIKDGFVSPEKALEYAANEKIEGQIRVVRVASPLYGGEVVTQKLYTLKKVGVVEKKTRKSRAVKDEEFNKALSDVLQKSQQTHKELEKLEDPPAEIVLDGAGERQGPGEGGEALPPDEGLNPDPDETV